MFRKYFFVLCIALFTYSFCFAQGDLIKVKLNSGDNYALTQKSDTILANRILSKLSSQCCHKSFNDMMVETAKCFLETPYIAATLEGGNNEELRIFLHKTDCILFVETCFNLILCTREYEKGADFEKFADLVRQTRYRDGIVKEYSDRIHYTTEWIFQNQKRNLVEDITEQIGGVVYDHPIFYMSKNYKNYTALKDAANGNQAQKDLYKIALVEKRLNEKTFYYIPKDKIPEVEKFIKSGDIICYMSGVPGLDIAHVAIAYVEGGKVGFIHASMGAKKVIIDPKSIYEYCKSSKSITGIKVVRPIDIVR